ncbi:MAG: hypothetical protein GY863_09415, partial [bacterium]|nr:hypothetical protein [bacterium]
MNYNNLEDKVEIGYVQHDSEDSGHDISNVSWLRELGDYTIKVITYNSEFNLDNLSSCRILWIDLPDEKVYESIRNDRVYSNIIREYYYSGGNV